MNSVYVNTKIKKQSIPKMVNIRVDENLYNLIKKEAVDNDFTIKNLILYCVLSKIKENKNINNVYMLDNENLNNLIYQVNKIGININQITKKINSNQIKQVNFEEFVSEFNKIKEFIDDFQQNVRKVR